MCGMDGMGGEGGLLIRIGGRKRGEKISLVVGTARALENTSGARIISELEAALNDGLEMGNTVWYFRKELYKFKFTVLSQ